jgi:hypothetical protein
MASRRVGVRDTDHGFKAFMKSVRAFEREKPRMVTGIIGATAPHAKKPRKRAADADIVRPIPQAAARPPLSVVEIARVHEFGLGNAPERSFLRSSFDDNARGYQRYMVSGIRRELLESLGRNQVLVPAMSVTLKRVALKREGDVKRKIRSHIPPPNTPATIRRKGSSTPLVDTGEMMGKVGSELRRGGGAR